MKKIMFVAVLALAACGGKSETPAPVDSTTTDSVAEVTPDTLWVDSSLVTPDSTGKVVPGLDSSKTR